MPTLEVSFSGLCLFRAVGHRTTGDRLLADEVIVYLPNALTPQTSCDGTTQLEPHRPTLTFPFDCWRGGTLDLRTDVETVIGADGSGGGLVRLDRTTVSLTDAQSSTEVTMPWKQIQRGDVPSDTHPGTPSEDHVSWVMDLRRLDLPSLALKSECNDPVITRGSSIISRIHLMGGTLKVRRTARRYLSGQAKFLYPPIEMRKHFDQDVVWKQALAEELLFTMSFDDTLTLALSNEAGLRTLELEPPLGTADPVRLSISNLDPHPMPGTQAPILQTHFRWHYELLEECPQPGPAPVDPGDLDTPVNALCPPAFLTD